ncbi:MAG TPA: RnfABCDGE type electron transport complex subunit D [Bacillota bacterium]|nr:RnfABCDGE type electron transport complex subunit D [Bacillota bacterium]
MKMMKGMLLALTPAAMGALYFYRLNALLLILVSVSSALAAEAVWLYVRTKSLKKLYDGSAAVTGLLLALTVSPSLPLYVIAAAAVVAIVVGKQLFGGYGKNMFNPALVGRLFIVYAFPGTMSPWLSPVDLVSTATPLQVFRSSQMTAPIMNLFIGNVAGSIGETSAVLLLLGAGWLFYKRYANWRVSVGVLGAVAAVALLYGQNPLFHLFSGSVLLGALFMATDPITSPRTQKGRYIFGVLVGLLVMAMRLYGWLPEGTTFAILGANAVVPMINKLTAKKKKSPATKAGAKA